MLPTTEIINVGIVDDKLINRKIIVDKLSKDNRFFVSLQAKDGKDYLTRLKDCESDNIPDLVLMDLEMPNMDGVAAIAAASVQYTTIKHVVLSIYDDDEKIFLAIKAGAVGYLLKDENSEDITEMLWQTFQNQSGPVSPGIAFKILQLVQNNDLRFASAKVAENKPLNYFQLSEREQEILQLLVKGASYKEIGKWLFISVNTAKKHVLNIYGKLHINSRAEAMQFAYKKGWIDS